MRMSAPKYAGLNLILAAGICWLAISVRGVADDAANVRDQVQKIADAIEKGDTDQIKKMAGGVSDVEAAMNLMKRRDTAKKGVVFGVGKTPGKIKPDGIEGKIQGLSKKAAPQKDIDKESADLAEMAYRVAAIAEIALANPPEKDTATKKKKDWLEWADAMRKGADDFAAAAKAKKPKDLKDAAAKLNASCSNCHGVFKD